MTRSIRLLLSILHCLFLFIPGHLSSQNSDKEGSHFYNIEIKYVGDFARNFSGGISKENSYMGLAALRFSSEFRDKGILKNTSFSFLGVNTHSTKELSSLTGDLQVTSNIEAGNHTYVQELWICQKFGRFDFTFGLQDMNVEFANTEYAGPFLNSSFGVIPVISSNINAPIFPLTSLGLMFKWTINDKMSWATSVHDANPEPFEKNPHNLKWPYKKGDGLIFMSEFHLEPEPEGLKRIYEVGLYSANNLPEFITGTTLPDSAKLTGVGFYANVDRGLVKEGKKEINLFIQCGYSPSGNATSDGYFGFGVNHIGLFSKKGNDMLGAGIACAHLKEQLHCETAIELTYHFHLTDYFSVQPDFQYIINPSGNQQDLNNAFVGNLRINLSFNN
ncbi:MAG: carbohydrate porin [Chloroflexota bacterium]